MVASQVVLGTSITAAQQYATLSSIAEPSERKEQWWRCWWKQQRRGGEGGGAENSIQKVIVAINRKAGASLVHANAGRWSLERRMMRAVMNKNYSKTNSNNSHNSRA